MYKVDMYVRVRRACMVEGMSIRVAARVFGLHRDTVCKMLMYSVPPGYRRERPPRPPKLEPYAGVIDRILDEDLTLPKKQRHTAKRIYGAIAQSASGWSRWRCNWKRILPQRSDDPSCPRGLSDFRSKDSKPKSWQFSLTRPTRLDKIKNLRIEDQVRGVGSEKVSVRLTL